MPFAASLLFGIKNESDYAFQVLIPNFETWLGGKWWGDFNQIQEENGRGEWQGENSGGKMAGEEMAVRA